ncbi:uncharacterized protein LOC106158006 [Lingula anatina]|uniref:Uncharacterized protein LOC106158006 n=1 Tax=Lingula anatina TaxID=7574 RepID=A0A1S3HTE7_LINAN|nr:uncharacterized protein LOC106158006 [Lingula anatina]|eukprot:XP_013389293.2 uncharacterized protein LOC106158006 [Lingula anatina]
MHRCLYGIVHPDDHHEVKMVLEQTIIDPRCQPQEKSSNYIQQMQHEGIENVNRVQYDHAPHITPKAVSFLCRMKCFNGTATGYLKMHCSGHMHSLPNALKSTRTSCQVVFAYCRPFMLSSNDPESDLKQNVFWSKHEMDLTFKQLDKKSVDVIGFSTEEIDGKSFYSFVHPEDLATCIACHKAFTESQEIQTMYFRFMCKSGNWIWLHTRGKVVFKNAKKYSVVFSHCPVREEDSTYIQQEVMLRTRYAIQDLMYSTSLQQWGDRTDVYQELNQSHNTIRAVTRYHPYGGLREEDANSLHSPHGTCPSSWHSNSERHSPVFPSTHMPHKYFQRERQYHMEEIKRKATEKEMQGMVSQSSDHQGMLLHQQNGPVGPVSGQLQGPLNNGMHLYPPPPQGNLAEFQVFENQGYHARHFQVAPHLNGYAGSAAVGFPAIFGGHSHEPHDATPQVAQGYHASPPHQHHPPHPQFGVEFWPHHPHTLAQMPPHLPLSPPPSPSPHYHWKTMEPSSVSYVTVGEYRHYNTDPQQEGGGRGGHATTNRHWPVYNSHFLHHMPTSEESPHQVNMSSMRHDPRYVPEEDGYNHQYQVPYRLSHNPTQPPMSHADQPSLLNHRHSNNAFPDHGTFYTNNSAHQTQSTEPSRLAPSDIDMSTHMKIVEEGSGSHASGSATGHPVNSLPSVGSFLEYLNDV